MTVPRIRFLPLLLALAALALPGLAPAQPASGYTWKSVAITGGGFVSGIVFHPAERDLVYARTDVGGACRWSTATQRWVALNDDIGGTSNEFMILGVLSVALDPRDANRVYLACGQYLWRENWNPSAILASNDRGATWTRVNVSFKNGGNSDGRNTGERLQVDPNDGRLLFMGTNQDGLWKSTDRGATWNQVTSFTPTSCTLVLFDQTTGSVGSATQTIYVGVNSTTSASLYRSTDAGATWTAVPGQPAGLMPHHAEIGYGAARTLYLAYSNAPGPNGASTGAVWKLDVSAGTWTNISPPAGSGGFGGLSVDASDSRTLVVSTLDRWSPRDVVYRSTDAGATWRDLTTGATYDHTSAPWAATSTPHWIGDVKLDPFNSARALFVTGYGLYATTNATTAGLPTWSFFNPGLEETVPLELTSPSTGAPLVSVLGDIDGFRHDNLDAVPAARHTPRYGTNGWIDFAETAPAIMGRTFNSAMRGAYSTDGGSTWTVFATAPNASVDGGTIAVSADGARFVWVQPGTVPYYSTNRGGAWTAATGAPAGQQAIADRANANKFYVYDNSGGRVFVSTSGGATFTAAASVPTGGETMRAAPGLEGNLWIPCWGSGLRRSTDSGATFATVSSVQEAYAVGFGRAATGQTHPAVFIWGRVAGVTGLFRSDNAGATWLRINDDQHNYGYINCLTGDPRIFGRVYLGTSGRGIIYGSAPVVATPPTVLVQPASAATGTGARIVFAVLATDTTALSYQWRKNGADIVGATAADYAISGVATADAGTYTVVVRNSVGGSVTSDSATLTVSAQAYVPPSSAMINISTRAQVGIGGNVMIAGFVIGGSGSKKVLIRAVGPGLAQYLPGTLADPKLELTTLSGTALATNDDWGTADAAAIAAGPGAPLAAGSKDAALIVTLPAGSYTAQVKGVNDTTGLALVELYDLDRPSAARLINLSTRAQVGTGGSAMVAGFVVVGSSPRNVLVRALGPTLSQWLPGTLPDPQLNLTTLSGTPLATNDNWDATNGAAIAAAGAATGAYPLTAGTRDSALLASLPEGQYTPQITDRNGANGLALVEVYEAP